MKIAQTAVQRLQAGLGDDHPYTLAAQAVLGVLLADQDEPDRAEQVESQAVHRMAAVLGKEHPDTLRTRANLLLTAQQRATGGAAAERDRVIDQLVAILGADHPHIGLLRRERRLMHTLEPQPF